MKIWDKFSPRSKRNPVQDYATVFHQQIEADRIYRGIPTDVDGFRAKFSRNLIGHWQTENDADAFSTTVWKFFADGTAIQTNYSTIVGDNETKFLWRERSPFVIELREASDDDEGGAWFPLVYNFKSKSGQIVLLQMPENPTFKFYLTTDYLVFQGDN